MVRNGAGAQHRSQQRERDNYYGELEVILSFLAFNSITGMSEHHRRAYKLLSGAPQTLSKQGIWTFGAPSVLGLYLRTGCSLRQTVEDMQECMPPYYLLSGWHGAGVAELTEAEALLLQGRIDEMDMPLQKAYYQGKSMGRSVLPSVATSWRCSVIFSAAFTAVRRRPTAAISASCSLGSRACC